MTTLAVTLAFACVIFYCFVVIWRRAAFAAQECARGWKARAEFAESEAERWRLVAVAAGGTLAKPAPHHVHVPLDGCTSMSGYGLVINNGSGAPPRAGVDA